VSDRICATPGCEMRLRSGSKCSYCLSARAKEVAGLPAQVYSLWDRRGQALYIGITSDLQQRIERHLEKPWAHKVVSIMASEAMPRRKALEIERMEIVRYQPLYNSDAEKFGLHPTTMAAATRQINKLIRQYVH
jgi:excinuclease UvrABC nuclease subunit